MHKLVCSWVCSFSGTWCDCKWTSMHICGTFTAIFLLGHFFLGRSWIFQLLLPSGQGKVKPSNNFKSVGVKCRWNIVFSLLIFLKLNSYLVNWMLSTSYFHSWMLYFKPLSILLWKFVPIVELRGSFLTNQFFF